MNGLPSIYPRWLCLDQNFFFSMERTHNHTVYACTCNMFTEMCISQYTDNYTYLSIVLFITLVKEKFKCPTCSPKHIDVVTES